MDLDYLYQRQELSLFMAEHGSCEQVRRVHGEFADLYAVRIAEALEPARKVPGIANS